jgi:hypothetical protein
MKKNELIHVTTWVNLKGVTVIDSKSCTLYGWIYIIFLEEQNYIDGEQSRSIQRLKVGGGCNFRGSFGDDGAILYSDYDGRYWEYMLRFLKNIHVHHIRSSTIHSSPKIDIPQMSTKKWPDKQIGVYKASVMEYYSAIKSNGVLLQTPTWVDLWNTMWSERSQTVWLHFCDIITVAKSIKTDTGWQELRVWEIIAQWVQNFL